MRYVFRTTQKKSTEGRVFNAPSMTIQTTQPDIWLAKSSGGYVYLRAFKDDMKLNYF